MTIEPAQPFDYKTPRLVANIRLHGDCAIEGCIFPHVPSVPLCEDHARAVWSEVNGWDDDKAAAEKAEREEWAAKVRERMTASVQEAKTTQPGIIYYLQVEDRVKIGFTSDLSVRLQSYPPMARLLATHPGTYKLEADMHKKFAHQLAGRKEWFFLTTELEEHIERVRKEFKQDRRVTA